VAAFAFAAMTLGLAPTPAPATPTSAQAATTVLRAVDRAGVITMERARDPATHAPGILITYRWDSRFGRDFDARVRILQDRHLVGRITFLRGGSDAPAFFRTTATSRRHSFRAVGTLLHRNGTVVAGSTERSDRVRWRRVVQPGQITSAR
jgi:hypothetical protein